MVPITPLTPIGISPYIGRPVCAVMQDGLRHYGILHGVGDGQLYLNVVPGGLTLASAERGKARRSQAGKARTTALWGPFGFGFGAVALSLALLAALFFIPWFWI